MANGFKALRHVGGGVQRFSAYAIADNQTDVIYNGDMVKLTNGAVDLAVATDATNIIGTFVGVMYVDNGGNQVFSPYWPGSAAAPSSTKIEALVNEDRNVTYAVEDTSGALAVGDGCDIDYTAGSTRTGQSGAGVVAGTAADFTVKSIVDADNNIVEVALK